MRILPPADIARKAVSIAAPLVVADLALSVLWIVDAFFVGLLGSLELAGVGAAGYLIWFAMVISTLTYMGAFVLASQAVGSGSRGYAERVLGESLTMSAMLGAAVALMGYLAAPIALPPFSAEALAPAMEYFVASLPLLPLHYAQLAYDAAFRAYGATRPIMYSVVAGVAVNIMLDPILIFGLGPVPPLGVRGAAYASVIATGVSLAVIAVYSRSLPARIRPLPPTQPVARQVLSVGVPAAVERIVFVGGNLFYLAAIARCGAEALAAHTIGVRIESLAFMPLFSLATAAGAMVGWEVGAGRMGEAERLGRELLRLSAVAGGVVGGLLLASAPLTPRLFTDDPTVERLAAYYLILAGATEAPLAVIMAAAQIIRSAGDPTTPTIVNTISLYALRVAPAFILPALAPWGPCALWAWIAMAIDVTGRGVAFAYIYLTRFRRLARRLVPPEAHAAAPS